MTGEFKNNAIFGYSVITSNNIVLYRGDVKNNQLHGFGVRNYGNGEYYKGNFICSSRNGSGKYRWNNGWKYKGFFNNNLFEGTGQLYNGHEKLSGTFLGGLLNGVAYYSSGYLSQRRIYKNNILIDSVEGEKVEEYEWEDILCHKTCEVEKDSSRYGGDSISLLSLINNDNIVFNFVI